MASRPREHDDALGAFPEGSTASVPPVLEGAAGRRLGATAPTGPVGGTKGGDGVNRWPAVVGFLTR